MNPVIALGRRMLYISCTSSIPPIWSEIYLRLSPARSLDYYFFVTPVTFHKSRTCKTDTPVYPFPVLTNPHELSWPPSTLDGWDCCLLSKTIVDYLASRLLYVTFDIIRDNSSQQLSLFEQLLSHSPYNNSTTTLWIRHSLVSLQCDRGVQRPIKVKGGDLIGTQPMLDWSFHVYLTRCFLNVLFHFWLHQSILSLELRNRMVLVKILDFCHHS